jgi:hypothetical protein
MMPQSQSNSSSKTHFIISSYIMENRADFKTTDFITSAFFWQGSFRTIQNFTVNSRGSYLDGSTYLTPMKMNGGMSFDTDSILSEVSNKD